MRIADFKKRSANTKNVIVFLALSVAALEISCFAAPPAEPFVWRNVTIGGGGFVTGILFHPAARDLVPLKRDGRTKSIARKTKRRRGSF